MKIPGASFMKRKKKSQDTKGITRFSRGVQMSIQVFPAVPKNMMDSKALEF